MLTGKRFELIDGDAIDALLADEVPESMYLEYKRSLPGDLLGEKKEFLADVSSFANAAGGDVIFGVEESGGVPTGIPGLGCIDVDREIQRIENLIRSGVAPRIHGLRTKGIRLANLTLVVVLRIPRSWSSPHMVTLSSSRFYSRHSTGKYPLDVEEIRGAFARSETWADRIREFRSQRVGNVVSQQTPIPLQEAATILLHSVPWSALNRERTTYLDPSSFDIDRIILGLKVISTTVSEYRPNLDGVVGYRSKESPDGYIQVFRDGTVEVADTALLEERPHNIFPEGTRWIAHIAFEELVMETADSTIRFQRDLGIEPPVMLMLSLVRVSGYRISLSRPIPDRGHPIDRDVLLVPELILESFDIDVAKEMRVVFDAVWNAAGRRRSINYDKEGRWSPQR